MTKWIKPCGKEIEINDKEATVEYAKSLGWELKSEKDKKPAKKKAKKD